MSFPTVIAQRYQLERLLGAGGMAATYLARDLLLGRYVAVKVLRQEQGDSADFARFEREARVAAAVSHPNVVQLYDAGQDSSFRYLVMEWVDGGDLAHLLRERAPLPLDEAVGIALDVLRGLAAIHRAGIVHRDVKPANVLIDQSGRAKLTDFGIARRIDDPTLTGPVELLGTAPYVAPERVRGEPATPASDLYAVGVLLYELLTGRLPYPGETPEELFAQHLHASPIPPRHLRPDLAPALEQVVLRALAKDPVARFRSAEAMAAALEAAWFSGRSLGAASRERSLLTDSGARSTGVSGRRPGLVMAGSVTVLSLVVAVVLALAALAGSPESTPRQASPTVVPVTSPTIGLTGSPTPQSTPTALPSPTPSPTSPPRPNPTTNPSGLEEVEVVLPTPRELRRFANVPSLTLEPSELAGAYLPERDGVLPGFSRDLAAAALLFGSGSGAEEANVVIRVPAGAEQLLIELAGRASRGTTRPVLQLLIDGRQVWQDANPFPGPAWSKTTILLRFDSLSRETALRLTLRNAAGPGQLGRDPWLAIRAVQIWSAD